MIILRFIFRVSPAGLVTRVFYDRDDLEPLLVTKQYLTSALSAHLQEQSDSEWEYSLEEHDHTGVVTSQRNPFRMISA